jgi:hypothetical protein
MNPPSGRSPEKNTSAQRHVVSKKSFTPEMATTADGLPGSALFRTAGLGVVLVGVLLRFVGTFQGLNQPIWRQSDLWAMAKSFSTEDGNPFHPRIAWRGVTGGLAESEFPLVPWVTSLMWRLVGEHDRLLRFLPFLSGLIALYAFWLVARSLVEADAAWVAVGCVALAPLAVFVGTAVQSDGVMFCASIGAVFAAVRWTADEQTWGQKRWAVLLGISVALAGLMKPTALHIGIAIATVFVLRRGWAALVRPAVVAAGLFGIGLPLAWAMYARTLFRSTGLSLGISNEHHFAGSELLTNSTILKGIVSLEARWVWGLAIAPVAVALATRWRSDAVRICLAWLGSAGAMLVLAGRTTGDEWAYYYHVVTVAPMALLTGIGVSEAVSRVRRRSQPSVLAARGVQILAVVAVSLVAVPWLRSAVRVVRPTPPSSLFSCAQRVRSKLPSGLLLTSGGIRLDDGGNGVAYDASYMFQWLDRRGWTIAIEDQTLETVESFAQRGAVAYFAETDAVTARPGFSEALRSRYPVLAVCEGTAVVYDLT